MTDKRVLSRRLHYPVALANESVLTPIKPPLRGAVFVRFGFVEKAREGHGNLIEPSLQMGVLLAGFGFAV